MIKTLEKKRKFKETLEKKKQESNSLTEGYHHIHLLLLVNIKKLSTSLVHMYLISYYYLLLFDCRFIPNLIIACIIVFTLISNEKKPILFFCISFGTKFLIAGIYVYIHGTLGEWKLDVERMCDNFDEIRQNFDHHDFYYSLRAPHVTSS